ncbi:hypothetical protein PISMIDRAFT_275021 [Pisolithus microcarpus 441]|uniref:Uncharacterized protein n=1 Tax=Pisolithus microcarpus 441 TaxID=765257 RepID=A0A0C9ZW23_9AGAM|nr:hypothetical protein PISMIDRAFT_275021 [Pisolithus microcarpus 441]
MLADGQNPRHCQPHDIRISFLAETAPSRTAADHDLSASLCGAQPINSIAETPVPSPILLLWLRPTVS